MQCSKPIRLMKNQTSPTGLLVPCGKCLPCRLQKKREWSLRLHHELESWPSANFLTLTYQDVYLPNGDSLCKSDLQKFFKRLRRDIAPRKIKYFASGEYGTKRDRPHYHAIVYGLGHTYDEHKLVMDNWPFCDWNEPSIRHRSFGLVVSKSIDYVADYTLKMLSGDLLEEVYLSQGREPPFKICSQGIGRDYADLNSDLIEQECSCKLQGKSYQAPRYYIKRLGLSTKCILSKSKELDKKVVMHYTGLDASSDDLYRTADVGTILKYESEIRQAKSQNTANLEAKIKMRDSKL